VNATHTLVSLNKLVIFLTGGLWYLNNIHFLGLCDIFLYGLGVQWNLDLSFFKGTEKTNDECGQTINPENYYTM